MYSLFNGNYLVAHGEGKGAIVFVSYSAACDHACRLSIVYDTARVYRLATQDGKLVLIEEALYINGR